MVNLFPTNIRYTGVSFSFNISFALFGSTTPIIAHYLQNSNFGMRGIALYVTVAAIISLGFAVLIKIPSIKYKNAQLFNGGIKFEESK